MADPAGPARPAGPSEPRAMIDALNATINAHDPDAGRSLYTDDAHLVTATGRVLDPGGLTQMLEHTLSAFPDLTMSVVRSVVEGDTIVTEEIMQGTHEGEFGGLAPTHLRVQLPMVHLTRVRDGHIIERIAYHDTAGILRQLQPAVTL